MVRRKASDRQRGREELGRASASEDDHDHDHDYHYHDHHYHQWCNGDNGGQMIDW